MSEKYISDLHLFDPASMDWRKSYISNLEDYASCIVDSWNFYTNEDDLVFIVGDLGYKCDAAINTILKLKGHKVLVIGNHDRTWGTDLYKYGMFQGVYENIIRNGVCIQHIPEVMPNMKFNYMVHGHHHHYETYSMYPALLLYVKDVHRYNCTADLNNNKPCTLQELALNKELLIESYLQKRILKEEDYYV